MRIRDKAVILEILKQHKGNSRARIIAAAGISRELGYFMLDEMEDEGWIELTQIGDRDAKWAYGTRRGFEWLKRFYKFIDNKGE